MTITRLPISFLATTNSAKTKRFYCDVMGLELLEISPFALVFADNENQLRVQIVPELLPAPHTVHGWKTNDIKNEIKDLMSRGAEFVRFDQLQQDELGVWKSPDGHKIVWFKDPSQNILSLTQYVDY